MDKVRADSWYAIFTEEELWQLYSMARRSQWFEVTKAAAELLAGNHGGATLPAVSRSAYYRWLDFMRGQESERRLAQARIAAMEVDDLSKGVGLKDETAIRAYKSLAAEIALKGDAKTASSFLRMAMDLVDRQLHSAEVDLKTKDLARKDEELKIAQEKLKIEQAKNAKAADAATDEKLTDAERVEKIKGIFGLK